MEKITNDKALHFIWCAIAAFLSGGLLLLIGKDICVSTIGGFICALAAGAGKEYGDECADNNNWDWKDILADVAGATAGSLIIALIGFLVL